MRAKRCTRCKACSRCASASCAGSYSSGCRGEVWRRRGWSEGNQRGGAEREIKIGIERVGSGEEKEKSKDVGEGKKDTER